jgi:hypothetical protein
MSRFSRMLIRACAISVLGLFATQAIAIADEGVYVKDPTFNNGRYFVDAFSGSSTQTYRAKKLVRMDNGDVIVAGLVPALDGGNAGGLGLVRYNAAGQRVAWANPGAAGFDGNQYVVYNPNLFIPRPIDDVKAIKILGNRIFVLVEVQAFGLSNTIPPQTHFRGYAADVVVFNTDGAYLGGTELALNDEDGDVRNLFGGGVGVYQTNLQQLNSPTALVFAGTSIESGTSRAIFRRFTVNNDNTFDDETGLVYIDPAGSCNAFVSCEINALALGGRLLLSGPPRIYLGGSRLQNTPKNWDFIAIEISSSGVPTTSFGLGGLAQRGFNLAGGTYEDHGRDIAVIPGGITDNQDQIFVGGDESVNCGDGIGIVKFNADGAADPSFGPGHTGAFRFADVYSDSNLCLIPRTDNHLHALVVTDDTIAIVGQRDTGSFFGGNSENSVDAILALLPIDGSHVFFQNKFPYTDIVNGPRTRHSGLWGVVSAGNDTFTAAGDVRYFSSAPASQQGKMQFATVRFAQLPEEIFKNGFDVTL